MSEKREGKWLVLDERSDMVDEFFETEGEAGEWAKKQSKEHGGVFEVWEARGSWKKGEEVG